MRIYSAIFSLCSLCVALHPVAAQWGQFRGPLGNGIAEGSDFPITWGADDNVRWKIAIPGQGWSSPVVGEGRVYLTSAVPSKSQADAGFDLTLICLDAKTGERQWSSAVFRQAADAPRIHAKNSHASPTPILDGKLIYVHFGHLGTACLDTDGKVVWKNENVKYRPVHGNGGSPILVKGKLVFSVDGAQSTLVIALNAKDGTEAWRFDRKSQAPRKFSFSTPAAVEVDGVTQIISPGSDVAHAINLEDGSMIWKVTYDGYSVIPRPVFGHGMVFFSTSYNTPFVMAVRLDGTGDVTDTHVAWSTQRGAPHTPSLLLVENELYMVSDRGIASCLDAKSGKVHWQQRVGSAYSASPLYADGKIYLQSEDGVGVVLQAGREFKTLAKNELGARTLASYGVVEGDLLIRTAGELYRVHAD